MNLESAPLKSLCDVSRNMVDPQLMGDQVVFHYSLPAWHEFGTGLEENASSLASGKLILEGSEVLVSKLNPEKGAVIQAEPHAIPTLCSPEFIALTPRKVRPRFLYYLMLSQPVRDSLQSTVESVTNSHKRARVDKFLASRVYYPDLATQKTIADFLDRETSRIDQLIGKKQKLVERLEGRWDANLDQVICGRSSNAGAHVSVSHPAIPSLPESWLLTPLKHLTDIRRPIMYGIVLPGPNVEEGVMIVKGGDVKPGSLTPERLCKTTVEIESAYERSRLVHGDLVISIRGSIGEVEIVPRSIEGANLTQDAARIAPSLEVDRDWLRFAIRAESVFFPLQAKSMGAAVRGINIFDLKRLPIPTPPVAIQRTMAQELSINEKLLNNLVAKVRSHITTVAELRSSLITAAVTGQLDISAWSKRGDTERRLESIEATAV